MICRKYAGDFKGCSETAALNGQPTLVNQLCQGTPCLIPSPMVNLTDSLPDLADGLLTLQYLPHCCPHDFDPCLWELGSVLLVNHRHCFATKPCACKQRRNAIARRQGLKVASSSFDSSGAYSLAPRNQSAALLTSLEWTGLYRWVSHRFGATNKQPRPRRRFATRVRRLPTASIP